MERPPGDWSRPYLAAFPDYAVYVNAMEVIMFDTDADPACASEVCSTGIGLLPAPVASECDNGIRARSCLPTPRVPPPTLAQRTENDNSGGIAQAMPISKSSHSLLERPPGAWKFPNRDSAATYVAFACAGYRHLVGTASAWVAGSSGFESHNQAAETAKCQDTTDVCTTVVGIQVIEV